MTEKRFTTNGYKIYDNYNDGMEWLVNNVEAKDIVEVMNNLDIKARERSKALSKLQKENEQLKNEYHAMQELYDEHESLKQKIKNSIQKSDNIKCDCNPCVVEECIKKMIECKNFKLRELSE